MIKKVYLDMDGVLSDFDAMLKSHWPKHKTGEGHLPDDLFWKKVKEIPNFWTEMPLMPGALYLFDYVSDLGVDVEILTAPSKSDERCIQGKLDWVASNICTLTKVNFSKASEKRKYAKPEYVLIDDNEDNIKGWIEDGGYGILHTDLESTLKQLVELELLF